MSVSPKVRREVIARDQNICQWCGLWCETEGGYYSLQHRRARGMGGSSMVDTDLAANLVLVHGSGTTKCHGEIESHRDDAIARGFNVPQGMNPAAVPMLVKWSWFGTWVLLDSLGGREQITAGEAETIRAELGLVAA